MNVLLIGSGGREHAIAAKIAQSPALTRLFIAPGNTGTARCGQNVELDISDFESIGRFVAENKIDLLVVGPEEPLVKGIADYFSARGVAVAGPSRKGAMLEGSKEFAKEFMTRHGIPTARYRSFDNAGMNDGHAFLDTLAPPFVLKADGLAAGKGVIILENREEAKATLDEMLAGKFGAASSKVVIEEYLSGIELSVFALADGKSCKMLPEAKDYKRIGDGDRGLNTGGMGAVSPVPFADEEFMSKVRERIVEPTVAGLQKDGIDYRGFIFFGLMNCGGEPYVIEYNARMGDPETEAVLPRLDADLLELLAAAANGTLDRTTCAVRPEAAVTVVAVSGGYPEKYEKGFEIEGIDRITDATVFHAGTVEKDGRILTAGGRVLAVTALADTLDAARDAAYESISKISFNGCYYRKDIGKDLLENYEL
jgi:phosphoribosylamine--glycine ligase